MSLAKECKAASEKLSKLDVCTSDVRYAIRILREAAETLEAAENPREPIIIPPGMTKTQIEVAGLGPPRDQGECAARKVLAKLIVPGTDGKPAIHLSWEVVNEALEALSQPCRSSMTRDAVAKLAESTFRKLSDLEEHRCVICHWPLAGSIAEGCIPGNCSYRPGEYSPEWHVMKNRHKHLQIIADAILAANQPERRGE